MEIKLAKMNSVEIVFNDGNDGDSNASQDSNNSELGEVIFRKKLVTRNRCHLAKNLVEIIISTKNASGFQKVASRRKRVK